MGGLAVCFYTDWDNIQFFRFPKRDGQRLVGNIYLQPGCTWGMLAFTTHTSGFDQVPITDRRGTIYSHEIKGLIPKATPELDQVLYEMNSQRRYAVLFRDRNGYLRLSGSPDYGLQFSSKYSTQEKPDGFNAHQVSFKADALEPALYYSGTFEVTDQGMIGGPAPGSGSADPVIIRFNGDVVKVVQPGEALDITSEFTMEFAINII